MQFVSMNVGEIFHVIWELKLYTRPALYIVWRFLPYRHQDEKWLGCNNEKENENFPVRVIEPYRASFFIFSSFLFSFLFPKNERKLPKTIGHTMRPVGLASVHV